jgi:hypothetical protein
VFCQCTKGTVEIIEFPWVKLEALPIWDHFNQLSDWDEIVETHGDGSKWCNLFFSLSKLMIWSALSEHKAPPNPMVYHTQGGIKTQRARTARLTTKGCTKSAQGHIALPGKVGPRYPSHPWNGWDVFSSQMETTWDNTKHVLQFMLEWKEWWMILNDWDV